MKKSLRYGQDQRGAIWELDLSFGHTTAQPSQLASYHGQPIVGLVTACEGHLVASTGDNQLKVTDVAQRKVMASFPFSIQATSVEWSQADGKPANIAVGFNDGTVRIMSYGKSTSSLKPCLIMLQALRPHGKRVTSIHQAPNSNLIATASNDNTIFFFQLEAKGVSPVSGHKSFKAKVFFCETCFSTTD